MKRIVQSIALILISSCANAQFLLPYSSGFDNPSETAGWKKFTKGFIPPFVWEVGPDPAAPSPPNIVSHDYPVGGAPTLVEDWYVSPRFDLTQGGTITSLDIRVFSISGSTQPDDHFGIYLLEGSADPAIATVTQLIDLTSQASSSNTWSTINNIIVPPVTGQAYIGFKYTATNNWFVPAFDNFDIEGNPAPPPTPTCDTVVSISVYNVTSTSAQISWPAVKDATGYEFAVQEIDTEPTSGTPTTLLSKNAFNLEPNKSYYAYVRSVCSSTDFSKWKYIAFTTKITTGIDEADNSNAIQIYPNPVTDILTVGGVNKGASIEVIDIAGRRIMAMRADRNDAKINVGHLSSGLYYLRVSNDDGIKMVKFSK